jgi:hypothetical protein
VSDHDGTAVRSMRWVSLALAVAALATVALTGFVTFWDDDAGEDVFVLDIDRGALVVFVLLGVLVLTIAMSSWRSSGPLVAVVVAFAAATMLVLIRRSTLSAAAELNDYLAVEGASGGLDSSMTRARSGNLTSVDSDIIDVGWMIGAGLTLASAVAMGLQMWIARSHARHL